MSLLPSSNTCCDPCEEPTSVQVPGPQGPAGADGADGTDGINAFTTADSFIMPDELDNVPVTVADSSWMVVGENVWAKGGSSRGTFEVQSIPTPTSVILKNLEDSPNGLYANNSAPTSVFPAMTAISPSGLQGPAGPELDPNDFFQVANNLSEGTPATMRTNLGLGSAALFTQGVANGEIPNIHDAGGIGNNEVAVGTGLGLQGLTYAQLKTALGITIGTADTNIPPVNDASGLTNGEVIFATATGLESVTASTARSRLGVTNGTLALINLQHRENSGTDGGTFTQAISNTVPINTEMVDTGSNCTLAGNQFALLAGTYRYSYGVVGFKVNGFQGWLQDVTHGSVLTDSQSSIGFSPVVSATGYAVQATGSGRFTIASTTTFELQATCGLTGGQGFGIAGNFSIGPNPNEVYSWIILEKEA